MTDGHRKILICSCEDTMQLDREAVQRGCRGSEVKTAHQLCRREIDSFRRAAQSGTPVTVGCTQEAPLFSEVAGEIAEEASAPVRYVNLRETAGWSRDAARAGPKMAALLAAAAEAAPEIRFATLTSDGVLLIYGRDEEAITAAALLKDHLDVTVMIQPPAAAMPPRFTEFPVVKGTIRSAKGHLGAFELLIDDYAQPAPSSRGTLNFGPPQNGATSRCDIVLDLSGGARFSSRPNCATAICAPTPAIRLRCLEPCSRRAISSAPSTNRATSRLRPTSARIRVRRSSAASAASISARPAPLRRPAIMWRSTHLFARAAGNAPPSVRPERLPTRCRPSTR